MSQGVAREDMEAVVGQLALMQGQIALQRDLIAGLLGFMAAATPKKLRGPVFEHFTADGTQSIEVIAEAIEKGSPTLSRQVGAILRQDLDEIIGRARASQGDT